MTGGRRDSRVADPTDADKSEAYCEKTTKVVEEDTDVRQRGPGEFLCRKIEEVRRATRAISLGGVVWAKCYLICIRG